MVLSARDEAALEQATVNLADYLDRTKADLGDVAFTLQCGRRPFAHRRCVVASTLADAASHLRRPAASPVHTRHCQSDRPDVVFLFPGQGSQHAGMGRELYEHDKTYRTWFDRCADIVAPQLGCDLRQVVFEDRDQNLDQTRFAQPALFALSYALAKVWLSWGVAPRALVGHSVGEFVAACLADVFTLEDGLRLVTSRAAMMQAQPAGGMLSLRLPVDRARSWIDPTCSVAAVNAPALCVVSGPHEALAALEERCAKEEIPCKRLRTSHAFHSPMMDPVLAPFKALVRAVKLAPPRLPIFSTVSAAWLMPEQATDPDYWSGHLRATVRFADALAGLVRETHPVLLEVGPRNTLATLARQQCASVPVIGSLEETKGNEGELAAFLSAAGRLWLGGVTLDWQRLHPAGRRRVPLPSYPFQRQRYWVDPLVDADLLG